MRILLFGTICIILNTIACAQTRRAEVDQYTSQIQEQEQVINTFDFSKYDPIVEKQIKENFDNFKAQMEKAKENDPILKAQNASATAFYNKNNSNIEKWSKKITPTKHSERRVIQTY